jgi:hypothetical protein
MSTVITPFHPAQKMNRGTMSRGSIFDAIYPGKWVSFGRIQHAYIKGAGLQGSDGPLFRSAKGRSGQLTENPIAQADVYRMIRRRAGVAEILTKIGCHSFPATDITEYLRNGGKLEVAQQMANHESARTTGLYDRRYDQVSVDEVERIVI